MTFWQVSWEGLKKKGKYRIKTSLLSTSQSTLARVENLKPSHSERSYVLQYMQTRVEDKFSCAKELSVSLQ